jgi:hypothetical protein
MNDKILMLCYNEGTYAKDLHNLTEKLDKNEQINTIYKLFQNHKIKLTKPDDIYIHYWNVGSHHCKPNFNINNELQELNKYNIEIIGEMVSLSHGWVNSALSTIKTNYKILVYQSYKNSNIKGLNDYFNSNLT